MGIAEPLSIDPARVDSPGGLLVVEQIFDGLVSVDPDGGRPRPAAAARWRILQDGGVVEFDLRPGAEFHDGSPVRAEDFVYAWNRLADPVTHAPFAFLLEPVAGYREFHTLRQAPSLAGIEAVDPLTLRVTLTRPWPGFVTLTAHPALSPVPPSAASVSFDAHPVGNGAYAVAEDWNLGQPIVLERAATYAGPAEASIDRVEFDVYDSAEEGWPDFLAGDLDIASVPGALVPDAQSRYGDAGFVTLARVLYCGFNLSKKAFQDGRLRRAVSLALDRAALAAGVYGSVALPASGIVPPTIAGFEAGACAANCDLDVAEASRLVSGLPEGRRSFELDVIRSDVGEQLAEALAGQLEAVGLEVRPNLLDEETFAERLQRGAQGAFCLVWDADSATQHGMLEPLLAAGSPDNHSKVRSPRIDSALDSARASSEASARTRAYRQAELIALEILPVVPLVWFRSRFVTQPYVRGFRPDPLGLFEAAALDLLPEGETPGPGPSAS